MWYQESIYAFVHIVANESSVVTLAKINERNKSLKAANMRLSFKVVTQKVIH